MVRMPTPQPVLRPLTQASHFLVLTVDQGGEPAVQEVLADLAGLRRAVGFGHPDGQLSVVAGIGAEVWDRLVDGPRPAELHPFQELRGPRHHAPSTPGDLLFHIRAARQDLCFSLGTEIMARLRGFVAVADEVSGFCYLDRRDLLGFVDGTENPGGQAAVDAVVVGDEDPSFAGGSYVIVQKYLHDMRSWNQLTVEQQEQVIGRRKLTNVEIDAPGSHVVLNTITGPDGSERKIVRDNMAFGSPGGGEFGTYFIGYSNTPSVTEEMLRHMFLGDGPFSHDRILDFSTAVTGTLFFVPPASFLEDLADPDEVPTAAHGSLGIGDLRNRGTA
jgi:putative iron-dependent peroxidase